ncbi:MAG TPA: TetR/AcrR family transcriptional regulator [Microbacterium sp.]|nr:TetR/AcrR family transcriptional regulator [Microbacterium sp.]
MPKLWDETIEAHRQAVRQAALDATAALVAANGIRAVTMSGIAEKTGIGRATLYKYFPDVDAVLGAWHERLVASHLDRLDALGQRSGTPGERLRAVLEAYALIRQQQDGGELAALLHRGAHMDHAHARLSGFIRDLLVEAAAAGHVRDDVPPHELADYCLSALGAASSLSSRAAVLRLVEVTLAGMRIQR